MVGRGPFSFGENDLRSDEQDDIVRKAGVQEARQNLTELLDDVKKGREVVITDRGRPVARLAPVAGRRAFPDLSRVRAAFRGPASNC
jgi:prevent-host-death family protein